MNRELSLCLCACLCAMGCAGQSGPESDPVVRRVPPIDSAPMRAVGPCYAVQTGEWTPQADIGGDTVFLTLPSRIVVDTLPVTLSWYLGKPVYGLGLPRPFDRGYWKQ